MAGFVFWDVDTQNDFMYADGKLYVPGAEEVIPNLERLSRHARDHNIRVIASADDHVLDHPEISDNPDFKETYPPHCLRGTRGQQKISQTALRNPLVIEPEAMDPEDLRRRVREHDGDVLFHKHWFDVFTNPNVLPVLDELDPDAVVLYGVALDVCNRYAIEGLLAHRPRTKIYLVVDATKPIVADSAKDLLHRWRERGVQLVTTGEALELTGSLAGEIHTA